MKLSTEQKKARRHANELKYPRAIMRGSGCLILMRLGDPDIKVYVNDEFGVLDNSLDDLKQVIVGLISRYNAMVDDLNGVAVPVIAKVASVKP